MGTSFKTPIPRGTEARNLEINQVWSLKPRLTSRAGAMDWKAILLNLYQEPEKLRNWIDTFEEHTVTSASQSS